MHLALPIPENAVTLTWLVVSEKRMLNIENALERFGTLGTLYKAIGRLIKERFRTL